MAPFLVILGMTRYRTGWPGSITGRLNETRFYLWFMLFTIGVALIEPVNYLVHFLFLKIEFVHARILVVGLLPLVVYVARFLDELAPAGLAELSKRERRLACLASVIIAVATVLMIELIATATDGYWNLPKLWAMNLSQPATIRVALSGLAVVLLIVALRRSAQLPVRAGAIYYALCLALAMQTAVAANFQLNGAHARDVQVLFQNGDISFSRRSEFQPPSTEAQNALHDRVQRDEYRSVIVCDGRVAGGFCAAHIGQFWQLRLADGYYGIGVPARLAMLPWPTGLGLRHIIFTDRSTLPWRLLTLLNVKYALIADDLLYRDYVPGVGRGTPGAVADRIQVIENPFPAVPRVFFAENVVPVGTSKEAAARLFGTIERPEVTFRSVVEGFSVPRSFNATGRVELVAGVDRLEMLLDPSGSDRFLVVNELFAPRWKATVDGYSTPIYPTNVVMRGLIIPAGARKVEMTYVPSVKSQMSMWCYGSGIVLLIVATALLARCRSLAGRCNEGLPPPLKN